MAKNNHTKSQIFPKNKVNQDYFLQSYFVRNKVEEIRRNYRISHTVIFKALGHIVLRVNMSEKAFFNRIFFKHRTYFGAVVFSEDRRKMKERQNFRLTLAAILLPKLNASFDAVFQPSRFSQYELFVIRVLGCVFFIVPPSA